MYVLERRVQCYVQEITFVNMLLIPIVVRKCRLSNDIIQLMFRIY